MQNVPVPILLPSICTTTDQGHSCRFYLFPAVDGSPWVGWLVVKREIITTRDCADRTGVAVWRDVYKHIL